MEGVPGSLVERIYGLVAGGGRGLQFRDLFALLVLLARGTREEKIKCRKLYYNFYHELFIHNTYIYTYL